MCVCVGVGLRVRVCVCVCVGVGLRVRVCVSHARTHTYLHRFLMYNIYTIFLFFKVSARHHHLDTALSNDGVFRAVDEAVQGSINSGILIIMPAHRVVWCFPGAADDVMH